MKVLGLWLQQVAQQHHISDNMLMAADNAAAMFEPLDSQRHKMAERVWKKSHLKCVRVKRLDHLTGVVGELDRVDGVHFEPQDLEKVNRRWLKPQHSQLPQLDF